MLKYFFIFYIFSCSLISAASNITVVLEQLGIKTQIGRHLGRAITQRGKLLETVAPKHRFLFAGGHWVKGLSADSRDALLFPETETEQLHTKLAQKLINAYNSGEISGPHSRKKEVKRTSKVPLLVYDETPRHRFSFESDVQPNFLEGHCITATVTTRCPKVLVNLYEERDDPQDTSKPSFSKWFMPVEQAFFAQLWMNIKEALQS